VLRYLGPPSAAVGPPDALLGDWFVNRFVLERQPLLILVSSASLLPILEPARQVRTLADRLPAIVHRRLTELGIDEALIADELAAMGRVLIAPTNDRSILGTMNEFVSFFSTALLSFFPHCWGYFCLSFFGLGDTFAGHPLALAMWTY